MSTPVSTSPQGPPRAGRNLPVAIAVGVALGAIVLASLTVTKLGFLALVAVAMGIALAEVTGSLATADVKVPVVPVSLGGLAMLAGAYWGGVEGLAVALAFTALATMVWRLPGGSRGYVRDVSAGVLSAAYLPFMAGFAVLLLRADDGLWRVVTFIAVTIASDIGGYTAGVLFGRHPMAPGISPKKTWEGFAGSVVCCIVVGWLLVTYALNGPWPVGVLLGAVAAVAATVGDLIESLIKRDLGIKDMGSLLPGHGGLMDRLDSLLATVALTWLILHLLVAA